VVRNLSRAKGLEDFSKGEAIYFCSAGGASVDAAGADPLGWHD